jgi:hypothetical protein
MLKINVSEDVGRKSKKERRTKKRVGEAVV